MLFCDALKTDAKPIVRVHMFKSHLSSHINETFVAAYLEI